MSKSIEQDVAFIRELADILKQSKLTEIEVKREYAENDQLKVRLTQASTAAPAQVHVPAPAAIQNVSAPVAPAPAITAEATGPDLSNALTSPMVGTVYLAAEPGAEPFVKVGDTVAEGQTVLVIEAMKTMNQIPSPRAGTVRRILVANAEPVEFGHPMMIID